MRHERWVEISGHPDYLVSNKGRVKSKKTDKILKPSGSPHKTKVTIYSPDGRKTRSIPRLVATHFIRSIKENEMVVFKGDPSDMSVDNLAIRLRKHEIERKQYLSSDLLYLLLDIVESYYTQTLTDAHIKALSTKINGITHKTQIRRIDKELAEYCTVNGISVSAIKSPDRTKFLVDHRKEFSIRCRQKGFGLEEIGNVLGGRHHSTIHYYTISTQN